MSEWNRETKPIRVRTLESHREQNLRSGFGAFIVMLLPNSVWVLVDLECSEYKQSLLRYFCKATSKVYFKRKVWSPKSTYDIKIFVHFQDRQQYALLDQHSRYWVRSKKYMDEAFCLKLIIQPFLLQPSWFPSFHPYRISLSHITNLSVLPPFFPSEISLSSSLIPSSHLPPESQHKSIYFHYNLRILFLGLSHTSCYSCMHDLRITFKSWPSEKHSLNIC